MIILLMGVTASGKTTVGQLLSARLGWSFHDADDFHPPANIDKMSRGVPLTDEDRVPWLEALNAEMRRHDAAGTHAVVTCSALRQWYRDVLRKGVQSLVFVHLKAEPALLRARIEARRDHFMPPALLPSQLATLEEPGDAIVVDAGLSPETIVGLITERLDLPGH
jgi:gluconokinase